MTEIILNFLNNFNLSPELTVFFLSMVPVVELRGGIIVAKLLGMPLLKAYIICFLGNMVPIPFILMFIKEIFVFLKKFPFTRKIVNKLELSAIKKSDNVRNKQLLGLFVFVAIPLPGTGGWTGALIASLLNMPTQKSFFAITGGVLVAGLIMIVLSYFIPGLFGF